MSKHVIGKRRGTAAVDSAPDERESAPREASSPEPAVDDARLTGLSAAELYRRERARRGMDRPENDLLAEARKAYQDLLKAEAASGKGGRPRSKTAPIVRKEAVVEADAPEPMLDAVAIDDEHVEALDDAVPHDDLHDETHGEAHDEPHEDAHEEIEPEPVVAAPARKKTARKAAKAPAKASAKAPAKAPAKSSSRSASKSSAKPARKPARRGR